MAFGQLRSEPPYTLRVGVDLSQVTDFPGPPIFRDGQDQWRKYAKFLGPLEQALGGALKDYRDDQEALHQRLEGVEREADRLRRENDAMRVAVVGAHPVPGYGSTATLITCDPPGTSTNRLIVVGQQISPDPSGNAQAAAPTATTAAPSTLPGNGPMNGAAVTEDEP